MNECAPKEIHDLGHAMLLLEKALQIIDEARADLVGAHAATALELLREELRLQGKTC